MLKKPSSNELRPDIKLIHQVLQHHNESFNQLFIKYRPVVNKIWGTYYLNDMEIDDWYQEARIVMLKIIKNYDFERGVSFGSYYRQSLKNRFFDLIRRKNAQKRIPDQVITSFSANQEQFEDIVVDVRATSPESMMFVKNALNDILNDCSPFEKRVLLSVLKGASYDFIATREGCGVKQVVNAFERCKRKHLLKQE